MIDALLFAFVLCELHAFKYHFPKSTCPFLQSNTHFLITHALPTRSALRSSSLQTKIAII